MVSSKAALLRDHSGKAPSGTAHPASRVRITAPMPDCGAEPCKSGSGGTRRVLVEASLSGKFAAATTSVTYRPRSPQRRGWRPKPGGVGRLRGSGFRPRASRRAPARDPARAAADADAPEWGVGPLRRPLQPQHQLLSKSRNRDKPLLSLALFNPDACTRPGWVHLSGASNGRVQVYQEDQPQQAVELR